MRVVVVESCPLYYQKEVLGERISPMVPNPTQFLEVGEVIEGTNLFSDLTGDFLEDRNRPGLYVDLSHTDYKNKDAA